MSILMHRSWIAELVRQPETGMGFQVIELEPTPRQSQHVIVLNAAVALEPREQRMFVKERLEKAAEQRAFDALQQPFGGGLRVLTTSDLSKRGLVEKAYRSGSSPASDAVPEDSEADEQFLRFSAFADDVRILPDGSVRAGTYVTTFADGIGYVHTGMDAVRRYALPNPAPASHRFHLKPPDPIRVRRGTVQPANGQPGGGDEVIFDEQAPAGTCYHRDTLPDGV